MWNVGFSHDSAHMLMILMNTVQISLKMILVFENDEIRAQHYSYTG